MLGREIKMISISKVETSWEFPGDKLKNTGLLLLLLNDTVLFIEVGLISKKFQVHYLLLPSYHGISTPVKFTVAVVCTHFLFLL